MGDRKLMCPSLFKRLYLYPEDTLALLIVAAN
jgi:hypothetical protein